MVYEQHRLTIPSNAEYAVPQLRMMIREVQGIIGREITADEWKSLIEEPHLSFIGPFWRKK